MNFLLNSEQYERLFLEIDSFIRNDQVMGDNEDFAIIGMKNLREIQVFALLALIKKSNGSYNRHIKLKKLQNFIEENKIETKYRGWIDGFDKHNNELLQNEKSKHIRKQILEAVDELDYLGWVDGLMKLEKDDQFGETFRLKLIGHIQGEFDRTRKSVDTHPELFADVLKIISICRPILDEDRLDYFIKRIKKIIGENPSLGPILGKELARLSETIKLRDRLEFPVKLEVKIPRVPDLALQEISLASFNLAKSKELPKIDANFKYEVSSKLNEILGELKKKKSILTQLKELLL